MPLKNTSGTACAAASSTTINAQLTDTDQEFHALHSAFAQQGRCLHSSAAPDGSTAYWAERWGLVRYLPSLHDAALLLAQIGGQL
ncbi:hypothetical protein HS961_17390 [Comamonas piscis]|uniref:Uncharacterized protein n=1 Tax=Comamonas piscis TaxID=1562974 RepID=A0A7G5EKD9_9BURK|nr:hypothetical protein [Comamonas piscis]QMV74464.1 hypothetical protein HS961_17390 [Comamonas piscis]WSO32918.1 hypothetical protein VUJ63_17445 [Comamonas piscis]